MNREELFYNYFLEKETARYNKAKELLEAREFKTLSENFIHYVNIVRKSHRVESGKIISDLIWEITQVKASLPINADEAIVIADYEQHEGEWCSDSWISIEWNEYNLPKESTPNNLARNCTRDAMFKLERQPNGKDAKRYQKILDKILES